jgi:hypothetical protein
MVVGTSNRFEDREESHTGDAVTRTNLTLLEPTRSHDEEGFCA